MNECFLQGKIISKINFDFILNGENDSIAFFDLKLSNKSNIKIKAYDELADYCYSKLKKEDKVFIYGKLEENFVESIEIKRL